MKKVNLKLVMMLLGFTMVISCNNSKTKSTDSESNNGIETTEIDAKSNVSEETFKQIDQKTLDQLNAEIVSKQIKSEDDVMAVYRPKSLAAEGDYQYDISKKTTGSGEVELTLIETGIMDDSQAGQKVIMVLKKENDSYKILSMKENYTCWKDRGHENWSTEFCH
ncbi:hypothetical protein [Flavobacterium sp.]|uniref:hypothetical protein n=1 Tax=Flavobacterium sp. TaxID=239 RepID=UPI003C5424C2